jgi:hypothetical protein
MYILSTSAVMILSTGLAGGERDSATNRATTGATDHGHVDCRPHADAACSRTPARPCRITLVRSGGGMALLPRQRQVAACRIELAAGDEMEEAEEPRNQPQHANLSGKVKPHLATLSRHPPSSCCSRGGPQPHGETHIVRDLPQSFFPDFPGPRRLPPLHVWR